MKSTFQTKAEAFKARTAGQKVFKSKKWIATAQTPVNAAGGHYATHYFCA